MSLLFRLLHSAAFPLGAVELTGPGEITPPTTGAWCPYDYTVYSSVLCAESMRFYWLTYRNSRVRYVELSRLLKGRPPPPVRAGGRSRSSAT